MLFSMRSLQLSAVVLTALISSGLAARSANETDYVHSRMLEQEIGIIPFWAHVQYLPGQQNGQPDGFWAGEVIETGEILQLEGLEGIDPSERLTIDDSGKTTLKLRGSFRQRRHGRPKTIRIKGGSKLNKKKLGRGSGRNRPRPNRPRPNIGGLRNQGDNLFGLRDQGIEGVSGEEHHGRRRLAVDGNRTVLAIRVIAADATTGSSLSTISNRIYGTSGDTVNLKSQYAACSHGKLNFEPYNGVTTTGETITDGAVDVTIPESVSGISSGAAEDYVETAAIALLGNLNQFDHVMLCIPPGTLGNWIAYAYINGRVSVYNDVWCNYVSGQMHELGHNLGLAHSGEGGAAYEDRSGMMGVSYGYSDIPQMCFNGVKNWQLGWYTVKTINVTDNVSTFGDSWSGILRGITDYNSTDPQGYFVVVKIQDGADDYYVHFNRQTSFNIGTQEGGNQVLIAKRPSGTAYEQSRLVAKLGSGASFTTPSGIAVTIDTINAGANPGFAGVTITGCNDGNACTDDSFSNGVCVNTLITCDDGNVCTTDECDSLQGCIFSPVADCCGNGVCEAPETPSSCTQDCFEGPFSLQTSLCGYCNYIFGSNGGLMFDIEAKEEDIEIMAFKFYSRNSGTVQVYSCPGGHVGNEYSSSSWTEEVTGYAFQTGARQLVEIPESAFINGAIRIEANSRFGFFINFQLADTFYYDVDVGDVDAVNVEDDALILYEGRAQWSPFAGMFGTPVRFNGEVKYSRPFTQPATTSTTEVTTTTTAQVTTTTVASEPSSLPSLGPSALPSIEPSALPSLEPSMTPSLSSVPSEQGSNAPSRSLEPSLQPSKEPSSNPSGSPSNVPSSEPSSVPSDGPSQVASNEPSLSSSPSEQGSNAPSRSLEPSLQPSKEPSSNPSGSPSNVPSSEPSLVPSDGPSQVPSNEPSLSSSPSEQGSNAPSQSLEPSFQPSEEPSVGPSESPSSLPSLEPSEKASAQPSGQPSLEPSMDPSTMPSSLPSDVPTQEPSSSPSTLPSSSPSALPSLVPSTSASPTLELPAAIMESMIVSAVNDVNWTTVDLQGIYASPVPVCTVEYPDGESHVPTVARMQNVMSSSFEIRLQHTDATVALLYTANVHCLVVEEGAYRTSDGGKIEAQRYLSTDTDHKNNWVGKAQSYLQSYAAPVVVGQVVTNNDPNWSVFWSCGSGSTSPPLPSVLKTGKHVGEDTNKIRADETVGFIVMESGHGALLSTEVVMEASLGSDSISGHGGNTGTFYQYNYASPFASTPQVIIVSQAGMDGGDGSWAVLSETNQSESVLQVTVDEDQISNSERAHTTEQLAFIAMESPMFLSSDDYSPPVSSASMQSILVDPVQTWTIVPLAQGNFTNPIPVCTVQYSGGDNPTVVRMRNVTSDSFEIRLQVPGDEAAPDTSKRVHCLVVEEGNYTMRDGRKIEAKSYLSTVTDKKNSWNGQPQTYGHTYIQPVVVGQVMTYNDPNWSVFWACGSSRINPPSSGDLKTGKHVAEDPNNARNNEMVGYIVMEAGDGTDPFRFQAKLSGDTIEGTGNADSFSVSYQMDPPFAAAPEVIVVSLAAMDGNDGGWAVLSEANQTATELEVVVDEDQIDSERSHTTEQVAYIALKEKGVIELF